MVQGLSCSTACGVLDGREPVSPALAGGFFPAESPGKLLFSLNCGGLHWRADSV